jgi:outer membrane protein OmpA-like peptidoglycan-associated protein
MASLGNLPTILLKRIMMNTNSITKWTVTATMVAMLAACASTTPSGSVNNSGTIGGVDRNTAVGTGSGAVLGGVIGAAVSNRGNKNEGALIGAAIGGLLGGVVGNQYGTQIKDRIGNILNGTGSTATAMPDGSLKINFAGDMSFNSGSSTIKESFVNTLDKVAKVIAENPNGQVVITGHTDSTGNAGANQRLSLARANSVRDFFVSSGFGNSRISTYGRGASQPVATNDTEAGRAQNRRVEVYVFPPK